MLTNHAHVALESDAPVSLLDGCLDSLNVKRADAAQVDDLSLDTLLGEDICSLKTVADHLAVCYNGDVRALTLNLGLADGKEEVVRHCLRRHGEGDTVHQLVLENDDGVGVADGGLGMCIRWMRASERGAADLP